MRTLKGISSVVAILLLLAGCGGGGGSSGGPCLAAGCGGATSSSSSSSSGGVSQTYSVSLVSTDAATSASTLTLNFNSGINIEATVKDQSGTVVPGAKLEFSVDDATKATVTKGGSVLADAAGKGQVTVNAVSPTAQGTITVTVKASVLTGAGGTASAAVAYQLAGGGSGNSSSGAGVPSYLKYMNSTVTRLFIKGASAGNVNAVETTQVKFEVRDSNNGTVAGVPVYFDVTKRNPGGGGTPGADGITICCNAGSTAFSTGQIQTVSDSNGVATVTVQSGKQPMSFNVMAGLSAFSPASPLSGTTVLSNDEIIVSSNRPNQGYLIFGWVADDPCGKITDRKYPCTALAIVGDEKGQPVADGTVVNFVSSTGVLVADTLAQQPSGACKTKNSQCTVKYWTNVNAGLTLGEDVITAYVQGDNAPTTGTYLGISPNAGPAGQVGWHVTKDGSWRWNGLSGTQSNMVVEYPEANKYIRNCLRDAPTAGTPTTCLPSPTPDYNNFGQ